MMGIARESRLSRSKQDQLTEHFVAGIADSSVPPCRWTWARNARKGL